MGGVADDDVIEHFNFEQLAGFAEVAGVYGSDAARSRAGAQKRGLAPETGFADWALLMREAARLELAAAVIATPNHLHAPMAIAALEGGLHVICDKPLCLSAHEADAIRAAARAAGRIVGVTYTYSGYPAIRAAAALVAEGRIGALRLVQADYIQDWLVSAGADTVPAAAWRLDPARSGPAGTTADLGTHVFHMIGLITGAAPQAVSADLTSLVAGRALDDTGLVRLRYPQGARGAITVTQAAAASGGGFRVQVLGDAGGIAWRLDAPHELTLLKPGAPAETLGVPMPGSLPEVAPGAPGYLNAFAELYGRFAGAIRGEAVAYPDLEDGARGIAFVEAAVASSRADGAWVAL